MVLLILARLRMVLQIRVLPLMVQLRTRLPLILHQTRRPTLRHLPPTPRRPAPIPHLTRRPTPRHPPPTRLQIQLTMLHHLMQLATLQLLIKLLIKHKEALIPLRIPRFHQTILQAQMVPQIRLREVMVVLRIRRQVIILRTQHLVIAL